MKRFKLQQFLSFEQLMDNYEKFSLSLMWVGPTASCMRIQLLPWNHSTRTYKFRECKLK